MSNDLFKDIRDMHDKFEVHKWVEKYKDDEDMLRKYLSFRLFMIEEEMHEIRKAVDVDYNSEEVVDGLIDLMVFAIGTLDAFGVDGQKAWDEVLRANLNKDVGVKPGRANPLKLPDLIKRAGWTPPTHEGNEGLVSKIVKR